MFQLLGSPAFIYLFIIFSSLLLFVSFLRMCSGKNGEHQTTPSASMKVAEDSKVECTMLGLLEKMPKGDPLPNECMTCPKLVECLLKGNAFDWYRGQESRAHDEKEKVETSS